MDEMPEQTEAQSKACEDIAKPARSLRQGLRPSPLAKARAQVRELQKRATELKGLAAMHERRANALQVTLTTATNAIEHLEQRLSVLVGDEAAYWQQQWRNEAVAREWAEARLYQSNNAPPA